MSTPFTRTTRALATERSSHAFVFWGLALVILGSCLAWSLAVRITVFEVSHSARLEVERSVHPVALPIAGTILTSAMQLGKQVKAGDILVELDASNERLQLAEEEEHQKVLPLQRAALERQIAEEVAAATGSGDAAISGVEEAKRRHQAVQVEARFSAEKAHRLTQLRTRGQIAEIEALRALSDARQSKALSQALASEIDRQTSDTLSKKHERQATVEALRRDIALLDGHLAASSVLIARLRHHIDRHVIKAPATGEIGDLAALDSGAYVAKGTIIAKIVPTGHLKVIADFDPARILGRVRTGQNARLRLHGFPWAQYGSITARVDQVATEIRDGLVRVELVPSSTDEFRGLLQHGLPGSVEIEVERTSPFNLLVRAAGQMIARPVPTADRNTDT
jgi:membrane fusion protein, adhesin transport system